MNPCFETRKPIYEISPLILDAVLAANFDWRELANRLHSFGRCVPCHTAGRLTREQATFRMAHSVCRYENGFSEGIRLTLNSWHQKQIRFFEERSIPEICEYVRANLTETSLQTPGFLWALGSDSREGVEKLLMHHLRFLTMEAFRERLYPKK